MSDRDVDQLRYLREAPGAKTRDCFDDDTIAVLAEGTLAESARAALLPHLASCVRCRRAVASVTQALADPGVAHEVAVAAGVDRRRLLRLAIPVAAAAALLLVFAWPRPPNEGGTNHRGLPTASTVPVPIAPIGVVAGAESLQWTAVTGADRYRLTLSDAGGRVVYEVQLTDTMAALPDSVVLVSGRSYVWLVEARTGFDRWSTSPLVEFSIGGTPR
jgi:hypothetical protein